MDESKKPENNKEPKATWREFLETAPTSVAYQINDMWKYDPRAENRRSNAGLIFLYCENCEGERFFETSDYITWYQKNERKEAFLGYTCRNCKVTTKKYALFAAPSSEPEGHGLLVKIGEYPFLRISTPSRVISIIGPDRDLFLKGLKAEAQGLGIGSFGYYRRVVDNQWKRIVEQLLDAATKLGSPVSVIDSVKKAMKETQFKKAVVDLIDGIPASLLLKGNQNPLALLYQATSVGIHQLTDSECLERAKDIRLVLIELCSRIAKALKDEEELNQAVGRLSRITGVEDS